MPTPMNRMTRAAGMTIVLRAHFGRPVGCGGIGGGGGTWPQLEGPDGGWLCDMCPPKVIRGGMTNGAGEEYVRATEIR